MTTDTLLPCALCGGKGRIYRDSDADGFGTFYSVRCDGCQMQTGEMYASNGNDCPVMYAEVRERWNRRTTTRAAAGELPEAVVHVSKSQLDAVMNADSAILGRNVLMSRSKTIKRTVPLYTAAGLVALEAGRRDAERYRWLRDEYDPSVHDPEDGSFLDRAGSELDAAIDAAMQKEPKP